MAFTDMLGQYVDNRIQSAGDRMNQAYGLMTGDENAWNQQLGLNETEEERKKRLRREAQARGEVLPDDVVDTTTTKTYADGSQTETTRREIPAPVAEPQPFTPPATAQTEMAPQPLQQSNVQAPPAPQLSMAEQAHQDEMARAGQAPQPQLQPQAAAPAPQAPVAPEAAPKPQATAPVTPVAPEAAPKPQATAPVTPVAPSVPTAGAQPPAVPPMPEPGPGVQVAGPAAMPPPAPVQRVELPPTPTIPTVQAAPAVAEPDWMKQANAAGNDLDKLLDIAGRFPESRASLKDKLRASVDKRDAEESALKLIQAANNGDLKALNKIQQALRPETGKQKEEVTAGDYIKAYMYARLGLNKLAEEAQNKIIGKDTKFGQVTVDGSNWQIETNAQGDIVRAKDDEGNVATASTLNKLRAASMKLGTHAFGFTGGSITIPAGQKDAGQEYRQRTNAITGAVENVITTGPNAGSVYKGPPGLEKRVETSAAVKLNEAAIDFQTKPTIAAATKMMELAGQVDPGNGRVINDTLARIQSISPQIFNQVQSLTPQITGTAGQTAAPGASRVGGGSLLQQQKGQEAAIETSAQVQRAELKPPAEARGKNVAKDVNNQNFANETYDLIRPIASLVKQSTGSSIGAKVDTLAAVFGKGTEGAQAIAQLEPMVYPILANVPRFEGPQSDYDVKTYMKAAGDFANPEKPIATRLAALQGMITLLKKYDKAGTNDWTFGEGQPATSGTTSSGNKYKRIQ